MLRRRYYSLADYMSEQMGGRVQKLCIDGGFTCPNRSADRTKGGCTFCNNEAFNPSYCHGKGGLSRPNGSNAPKLGLWGTVPITTQIDEGIKFHAKRYRKSVRYLAYFQTFSNTNAPVDTLRQRYAEALSHPMIDGLVIATRPDCVDDEKLDFIASLAREHYVTMEYGIESCYDATLRLINRGHDYACTCRAIEATAQRGLHCGGHVILGLPGESRDMMLDEARMLNQLPLNSIKFHQLQILKGSAMADDLALGRPVPKGFALEEYIALVCDIVERLRPDMAIERFAGEVPPRYQACPERSWRRIDGRLLRNEELPSLVEAELQRRDTYQGCRLTK